MNGSRIVWLAVAWLAGCVRPPTVVVVDRQTALQEQIGGEYPRLQAELAQAGLLARPLPMTRSQIEASGGNSTSFEAVIQAYQSLRSDAALVDALLVRRCLGEALDGLLVETRETCVGEVDPSAVSPLVQRTNRNRRQLWAYMLAQAPNATEQDVRRSWRANHLQLVACGAQIQQEDGQWTVKRCDKP